MWGSQNIAFSCLILQWAFSSVLLYIQAANFGRAANFWYILLNFCIYVTYHLIKVSHILYLWHFCYISAHQPWVLTVWFCSIEELNIASPADDLIIFRLDNQSRIVLFTKVHIHLIYIYFQKIVFKKVVHLLCVFISNTVLEIYILLKNIYKKHFSLLCTTVFDYH